MRVLTSVNVLAEFPPFLTNVNPSPAVPLCRLLQVALTVRTRGWNASQKVTGTEVAAGSVFSWRSEQREKWLRLRGQFYFLRRFCRFLQNRESSESRSIQPVWSFAKKKWKKKRQSLTPVIKLIASTVEDNVSTRTGENRNKRSSNCFVTRAETGHQGTDTIQPRQTGGRTCAC